MQNQTLKGFRLSPQQKHLWSLQEDGCSYCTQVAILLQGTLNIEVLKAALQKVVNRHEILRTTFHYQPGIKMPIQVIADTGTHSWYSINLSNCDPTEQSLKIEELFRKERRFIFNFQKDPLLRLFLIILSHNQYILLINLPSLCADSWTLKNLIHEISQIYALCMQGKELLHKPIQYLQFSEWQNELLEEEDAETACAYWQKQSLITQYKKNIFGKEKLNQKNKFETDAYTLTLPSILILKINAIATKYNTNTFEFLLACWHILIWRLTKQSDIIISTLFAGRKYEELSGIIGLLAKWVPVKSVLNKDLKFVNFLLKITNDIQQKNQHLEYFIIEDNTNFHKGFLELPISFEFEELPEKYHASGVDFSLHKRYVCSNRFKVKLTCLQRKESLILEFHYDKLFLAENIKRLAGQFQTLVESALKNPEAAVNDLDILECSERQQLLVEFNNTQINYPQDKCIHQLFEEQVERTPNNIAVVFENQQLTYCELNTRANQLAYYLQQLGIKPEVLVGIYIERSLNLIIGVLGILKAGAAYVPLDSAIPTHSLALQLQDTQASILLTQQSLVKKLPENAARIICLDTDWQVITQEARDNPQTLVKPENLLYVIFTSGSTGKPKGVAIEHRQLANYLYAILYRLNLPAEASFATVSTFAADLGNTVIFSALCTGGCLYIISQERASDPKALFDYFRCHPIDCLKIVPSHLTALLTSSLQESVLPRQCLILGGEALSWDLIEIIQRQKPNCQIMNHYGPTETTVGTLTYLVEFPDQLCTNLESSFPGLLGIQNPKSKTVPLGRPLANTQVYVLDTELRPVPIGVPGELYIGGAGLARGYLNRHEEQAERFIPNPFTDHFGTQLYRTGDKVCYLPNGNLEFLGRVDYQVKIRGFRIELGEIEAVLRKYSAVQEVVVLVREKVLGDKRLVAYIVPNSKLRSQNLYSTLISNLRSFSLSKLPEYMVPSTFVLLKALPLTPNGKVDRQKLPAPEQTCPELEQFYVAPRTSVEKQVAEIWAKVLDLEQVGIHDNFFELGGHSLLLTQLLAQVRKTFKVELSLRSLFEVPTIAGVAESLEKTQKTESSTKMQAETFATLLAEAVLDPAICGVSLTYNPNILNPTIFLTGATGFLGAFLLYELLQQTQANIYCLVRSNNIESGKKKIQSTLKSYLLWDESKSCQIIPVVGDLSQPLLGLSQEQFQVLASKVDIIYHNGALVNFTYPYYVLKATNVLGTQEVLRLASQIKVKPVHFISTTSVVSCGYSGVEVILEQNSINHNKMPSSGYAQSKWVAEKLVTIARERGLPICIYRPGRISGSSKTGVCNTNDHTFRMIKGCIQLGTAPDRNMMVNISPVDYVSRAIVHLSWQKESLGKTFHLVNPHPVPWNQIVNYIRSFNYPLVQIPEDKWRAELLNAENSEENALYPLMSMFSEELGARTTNTEVSRLDCQNTLNGLAGTTINCPPVNCELFSIYFSYLIRSGFLKTPLLSDEIASSSKQTDSVASNG
ncbi:amino acid adenylation domain-containing protein [Scytonema sp. NUACC26]|uniref:non-ribosomal peptide synthetase family protein n=1 Tax=Scytonema sp. NUACC26 TaxID=3140176 RepID=UPI0034DC3D86